MRGGKVWYSNERRSRMNANENQVVTHDSNDGVSEDAIRTMIVPVRGVQVMLDRDLATLYGVEVMYLNRQVKRNIERFPSDFMFQLTKEDCLRCQIGTLNGKRGLIRQVWFVILGCVKGFQNLETPGCGGIPSPMARFKPRHCFFRDEREANKKDKRIC